MSRIQIQLLLCYALIVGCCLLVQAQRDEGFNFCDLPCVNNIYSHYCGDARCITGASDYSQIFTLCTETCAGAVAGDVMIACLTTTVPEREDWEQVQDSVVQDIVEFCTGYQIALDPDVPPLLIADTDQELLDTLFDDRESEEMGPRRNRSSQESDEIDEVEAVGSMGAEDEESQTAASLDSEFG